MQAPTVVAPVDGLEMEQAATAAAAAEVQLCSNPSSTLEAFSASCVVVGMMCATDSDDNNQPQSVSNNQQLQVRSINALPGIAGMRRAAVFQALCSCSMLCWHC
jgi:hypothetical protein